jgi:crotonobetainyl-CoA:carnitine CoA-transferase CaiB-like acyl-CoA transferase
LSVKDLFESPHLNERNFWVRLPHPEIGVRAHCGIPWKMSATPCEVTRPAPCLGADTDDVLSSVLGLDAGQIAQLRKDEVLI